jgi:hypothetical protein
MQSMALLLMCLKKAKSQQNPHFLAEKRRGRDSNPGYEFDPV